MLKSTAMSQSWTPFTRFLSLFFVRKRAKITELKDALQPKWLGIWKNDGNTTHWPYTNAEFEKKKFLNSSKFAPVDNKNRISRRGSKPILPPLPQPQFFGQFTPLAQWTTCKKIFGSLLLYTWVISLNVLFTPKYWSWLG